MESNTSSDQEVTRAIVLSLRDGISSFNSLCDSILNMDLTSPDTFDYEHIRVLIVNTEQAMRKTTQEAEGKLGKLDEDTENLTAQLHALAKVRDDNILNLDHLKTKLDAETQSLKNSEETLEQARTLLQNNEDVLNKQRSRKSTATAIAGASPAMLIVPVIGWIAAIAMAAGGGVEISEAEKAVHVAKEEVEKAECQTDRRGTGTCPRKNLWGSAAESGLGRVPGADARHCPPPGVPEWGSQCTGAPDQMLHPPGACDEGDWGNGEGGWGNPGEGDSRGCGPD
ncbi:uncharacterized protein LOC121697118 isoform X3 [Alosa sapidissima]|uniref:uncharacterized protein LOC121697118 isoform X3 n=1 Tax=Alosa sapidissima TaxID=34773 RepID=UPI001C08702C|nr:uncharacterized protein LOC121697118 isoform X3 [Alosa sapidissima]